MLRTKQVIKVMKDKGGKKIGSNSNKYKWIKYKISGDSDI